MRILSILLSLLLSAPAASAASPESEITRPAKVVLLAGGATAGAGVGFLAYIFVIEAASGPIGWATGIIFVGGLSSYLAYRRLSGENDFPPSRPAAAPPRPEPEENSPSQMPLPIRPQNPSTNTLPGV